MIDRKPAVFPFVTLGILAPGESSPPPAVEGVEPKTVLSVRDMLGELSTLPSVPALVEFRFC